jgi:hypothetical protein
MDLDKKAIPLARFSFLALYLLAALLSWPGFASAEGKVVGHFGISQVVDLGKEMQVFFELQGQEPGGVQGLSSSDLSASLGSEPLPVEKLVPFRDSGEKIAAVLLVDISKSLSEARFNRVREALSGWIEAMLPGETAALVAFGMETKILADFTDDKKLLESLVASLKPTDMETQLNNAIIQANALAGQKNLSIPPRRIILVLSDGMNDAPGAATREEVRKSVSTGGFPIFAVGYSKPGEKAAEVDKALGPLGQLARESGGALYREAKGNFPEVYASIREKLLQGQALWLDSSKVVRDGQVQRLTLTYASGEKSVSAGKDVRILPLAEAGAATNSDLEKKTPAGLMIAGIAALLGLLCGALVLLKRKKPKGEAPDAFVNVGSAESEKLQAMSAVLAEPVELVFALLGKEGPPIRVSIIDRILLGRDETCQLVIRWDPSVSGTHCELFFDFEKGGFFIKDLGSTNGTRLNGIALEAGVPSLVDKGDVITMGKTQIQLMIVG